MYFSILRDYQEQDVISAIKEVLKQQPYFPRVDEIVKYLPTQEEPNWFNQSVENNIPTQQEREEMQNILDKLTEE